MSKIFNNDYNIDSLIKIKPSGYGFEFLVTPRFSSTYTCGYEVLSSRLVEAQLASCELFIDVGAHYGYYTLLAAMTTPAIKVVAVEPVEENLQVLRRNIELNNIKSERVDVINGAISSKSGTALICKSEASDNCSLYPHPASDTLARVEVVTLSLDQIIASSDAQRIFIKIDTDGHELEVFKGLAESIESGRDITIIFELNPKMMKIAGTTFEELYDLLDCYGYTLYAIDENKCRLYPLSLQTNIAMLEHDYKTSYYNVICIPKHRAYSITIFSHCANFSGAERSLFDLIQGLTKQGVICNTILPSRGAFADIVLKCGSGVYIPDPFFESKTEWQWGCTDGSLFIDNLPNTITKIENILIPEIRAISPDAILSQTIVSPWGTYCAERLGIPSALSAREYGELDHKLYFPFGIKRSLAALYNSNHAIFCISHDVANTLFGNEHTDKISVVYSGVNLDSIQELLPHQSPESKHGHQTSKTFKIGIFATVQNNKGQLDLIEACIRLAELGHKFNCYIVGEVIDNDYSKTIQEAIDTSFFSSYFVRVGHLQNPYPLMAEMNVVVSCSKREALGRSLMEALLLGVPIIYTNAGGPREIYENGKHGYAYDPGDSTELANILSKVIAYPEEAKIRATEGARLVKDKLNQDNYVNAISMKLFEIAKTKSNNSLSSNSSDNGIRYLLGFRGLSHAKPRLFYSNNEGNFNEFNVILGAPLNYGSFDQTFLIHNHDVCRVRFDPIEGFFLKIVIYRIEIVDRNGQSIDDCDIKLTVNGRQREASVWDFYTLDPNITIDTSRSIGSFRILGAIYELSSKMLDDEVTSLMMAIKEREIRVGHLNDTLKERDDEIASLSQVVTERDDQIASLNQALSEREARIAHYTHAMPEQIYQTKELQNEIVALRNSLSWRITQPLRFIAHPIFVATSNLHTFKTAVRLGGGWYRTAKLVAKVYAEEGVHGILWRLNNARRLKDTVAELQPLYKSTLSQPLSSSSSATDYVPLLKDSPLKNKQVSIICFYLPQYHPILENNAWWGEGFTEWTNVQPAQTQFVGHYQPHVPGELGYYNLTNCDIQRRQVELAKLYGISGFCFYFYWFGGKRLLEAPIESYLNDNSLDLPFCLCWANENWTRSWDGLDREVLIAQQHSPEDDISFIQHVARYIKDARYIRINNKPLLVVYRPSLLPSAIESAKRWREWCRTNGIGEIYLAYTQSFESDDPAKYGFDAAIEFPPNNSAPPNITDSVEPVGDNFSSTVYDWRVFVERSEHYKQQPYTLFRSVCPSWDNTARRKNRGTVFLNSTPTLYQRWLENAIRDTQAHRPNPDERLIFVNAWNEWAEGAHLEPDTRYGYAWLQATRNALSGETYIPDNRRKIVLVAHDAHPHGAQMLAVNLAKTLNQGMGFQVDLVCLGEGPLVREYAKWATVHLLSGKDPCGSDAKELANQLYQLGHRTALINTTVSGYFLETLVGQGIKCVALIHELRGVLDQFSLQGHAKAIATHASKVVFPAAEVNQSFNDVAPTPSDKTVIRPQGLYKRRDNAHTRESDHVRLRQKLDLQDDAQIVLGVGYADHRKGIDMFVEAGLAVAERLPKAYWVWIGHWERSMQLAVEKLLTRYPELKDRFIFPGVQTDTSLFYGGADVFALTSREDPFPSVVLEALDASVPVVGFEGAGGFISLLNEGCGKLVPKENAEALGLAVADLMENPTERAMLGQCGADLIKERFSFRHYVYDLLDLLGIGLARVSVIVPNYNYAHYLPERLASIIKQDYPIYEIVFLDDCSRDESIYVAEKALRESGIDYRIIINQENSGSVFQQWRKGVELATGTHVWIAEADDSCDNELVSELLKGFRTPDVVLSYCESKQIDEDGNLLANNYLAYISDIDIRHWLTPFVVDGKNEIADSLSVKNTIPNVSAVLFEKNSLAHVLTNDFDMISAYRIAGDWLTYVLVLNGGRLAFTPIPLNKHRRHNSGMTISNINKSQLDEIRCMQEYIAKHYSVSVGKVEQAKQYIKSLQVEHSAFLY